MTSVLAEAGTVVGAEKRTCLMSYRAMSSRLVDLLGLEDSPIAITFHDTMPDVGVPRYDSSMSEPTAHGRSGRAAASYVFWMHAQSKTFDTVVDDHGNCSVGSFTHGFAGAEDIIDQDDVATSARRRLGDDGGIRRVAALSRRSAGVRYRPLGDATGDPDVMLLRVSPRRMIWRIQPR